jgi:hypothetical protein
MNVVSWGDINRSPDAGEFPFRDGTLSVSFADVAAWKCDPTASFLRMRKHPNRGQIGYVLGEQINQGQPCCESSDGDVWCLTLDAASGRRVVIHRTLSRVARSPTSLSRISWRKALTVRSMRH